MLATCTGGGGITAVYIAMYPASRTLLRSMRHHCRVLRVCCGWRKMAARVVISGGAAAALRARIAHGVTLLRSSRSAGCVVKNKIGVESNMAASAAIMA
jgi:hypothetical protein